MHLVFPLIKGHLYSMATVVLGEIGAILKEEYCKNHAPF